MPSTKKKAPSPDAAGAKLDAVLGYQLARASVQATSVFFRVTGHPLDLRPVEFTVLALIRENPSMSAARLAETLSVTPPNITAWLARLEKRGLIARAASETDRRAQVLSVTREGERMCVEAINRLTQAEQAEFSFLSPGEFLMLKELLAKVVARPPSAS